MPFTLSLSWKVLHLRLEHVFNSSARRLCTSLGTTWCCSEQSFDEALLLRNMRWKNTPISGITNELVVVVEANKLDIGVTPVVYKIENVHVD